MDIYIGRQLKQIFNSQQRRYYSNQVNGIDRCLEMSCRFFGLKYKMTDSDAITTDAQVLEKKITISIKQQALQFVKRDTSTINLNSLSCPILLCHKTSNDLALLIPKSQGKAQLYLSEKKIFLALKEFNINDWQSTSYELFPSYNQPGQSLKSLILWCVLKGNTSTLLMYFFISLLIAIMTAVPPIATGFLINHAIGVGDIQVIYTFVGLLFILALANFGLFIVRGVLLLRFQTIRRYNMLPGLIGRFYGMPNAFFETQSSGQAQQFLNMLSTLIGHAIGFFTSLGAYIIFIIVSFGFMFYYYWPIALFQLVLVMLFSVIIHLIAWLRKKPLWQGIDMQGSSFDTCFQYINAMPKFLGWRKTTHATESCQQSIIDYLKADYIGYLYDVYKSNFRLLLQGASILTTFIISYWLYGDSINVGSLIGFLGITGIFISYWLALIGLVSSFFVMQVEYKKANQAFLTEVKNHPGSTVFELAGSINIHALSFRYQPEVALLESLDLAIHQGQKVALLGQSNCGKTTLLQLMIGVLSVESGEILIDANPISTIDLVHYRMQIGFFSQDDKLFNGSLKDNITLGEPYSDAEILHALDLAQCQKILEKLPMKLSSIVSENVSTFSDGEQKRLLLARCLVKKPKILFLDEVLNGLDPQTSEKLMNNLLQLETTIIFASHDFEGLAKLDHIYYLQDGRIAEHGNYHQLMAQKGIVYQNVMDSSHDKQ